MLLYFDLIFNHYLFFIVINHVYKLFPDLSSFMYRFDVCSSLILLDFFFHILYIYFPIICVLHHFFFLNASLLIPEVLKLSEALVTS